MTETEQGTDSVYQRDSVQILATGSRGDNCQTKLVQSELVTGTGYSDRKSCTVVEARVIFDAKGDDAASTIVEMK